MFPTADDGKIIDTDDCINKSIEMIDSIDTRVLRGLDLNLLPIFAALLRERSTVRAAAALNLGQPAVSAALARLRTTFADPLFVRVPRGLEPTPRALELAGRIAPALAAIQASLRGADSFDPASSTMTLRLGMPDHHEHALAPLLLARIAVVAPGVRIDIRPANGRTAPAMLDADEIDLACGRIDHVPSWQRREEVAEVGYLCLFDRRQVGFRTLDLERFLSVPHLLASAVGDAVGVVDRALANLDRERRVVFTTAHFTTLPLVLQRVPAIATLPEHAARYFAHAYGLQATDVPLDLPRYATAMAWLARHQESAPHQWVRDLVRDVLLETFGARKRGARRKVRATAPPPAAKGKVGGPLIARRTPQSKSLRM